MNLKSELIVKSIGSKWELVEPFCFYYQEVDENKYRIFYQNREKSIWEILNLVIPKGFITDFASTPRILYPIIPPIGIYNKACIIHDYLYQEKIFSRKNCDLIFLQAMKILDVPKWKRNLMFAVVRLFGKKYYGKKC